jgi:Flp pilus assembly protein TadG
VSRRSDEAGVATTQVAVLMPALLFFIGLIVQFGLWYHAKHVAGAAADAAVDAAQTPTGTPEGGVAAARHFLEQSGDLANVDIAVERDDEQVVAEVHGDAPQLVPGFAWTVTARSVGPTERFVAEPDR